MEPTTPRGRSEPATENRPGYVIDVCRTCFRQAKYPFCEHYPYHDGAVPMMDRPPWCIAVPVKLTDAGWRDLKAARERQA